MKESEVRNAYHLIDNVFFLRFRIAENSKHIDKYKEKIKALQKENDDLKKQISEVEEELKKIGVEKDANEEAN